MGTGVKVELLPLDGPMPQRLAQVLRCWEARRGGGAAPPKAAMDPLEFPKALGYCLLAAIEPGPPPSARYVLVGEGVRHLHHHSLKGMAPEQLPPPAFGAMIRAHYIEAVETWRPLYHAIHVAGGSQLGLYLRLLLPLTDPDGSRISHLLAVEIHEAEGKEDLRAYLPGTLRRWLDAHPPARA